MTPIPAFPLLHLPPGGRNPNFTGREPMLARLDAQLHRAQGTVVVSQAITGLGGVGKTQLAVEYIYRQQADAQTAYDLVWWLRADTVVNLAADMAALAVAVGAMSAENPDQQAALNAARRWLVQTDKRWLLLVDNADDLPPRALTHYLPTGGKGHILITSRNPNWGGLVGPDAILPLDTFTRAEAIRFLQVRSRQFIAVKGDKSPTTNEENGEEEAEIGRLAELLGDFPLALEQAAAFMEARQMGCAAYRQVYETKRQEVWRRDPPPDRYHGTITTTWQMAFEQIQKTPGAVELLNLCCFLAPEGIPLDLVGGVETLPATSLPADTLALEDAVAALRRYSLVARDGDNLRLHRLVQTVARDRMGTELARQWAESTVDLLLAHWPYNVQDMNTWAGSALLLPHLQAAAMQADAYEVETADVARLWNETGVYLYNRGDYPTALPCYEHALVIREKVLGADHPLTATSLNNMGVLLKTMGKLAEARPYYERALAIHEKALEVLFIASTLNNLGMLLKAMGKLAEARPYLERALSVREKALGPDHPDTATSLLNLGSLLHDIGELDGAWSYYKRALAIDEKELGVNHPNTATDLNNLALLLQAMGKLAEALPYLERAVAIREKVLGPDHADIAQSLNNLGGLLQDMGDLAAARPQYQRALAISEKALGPDHPLTAASLNNLALLLQAMGDLAAARPYYERALAISEKVLGPDHPYTANSLNNMGFLLQDMGDLAAARPYYERALAIREKTLGPDHPDTALSLNNLGSLLQDMGDLPGARPYFQRALDIREKVLGSDHPDTAQSLNNLGSLLQAMGDLAAARPYYQRALAIHEKALGPDHPDTATSLNNLAILAYYEGDYAAAARLMRRALTIGEQRLGPQHPDTVSSRKNLAAIEAIL